MKIQVQVKGSVAALAMAAPVLASTTMVSCPGYVISLSDDVAIQGQGRAGSVAAFEKIVCEHSSDAKNLEGYPKIIPVFIEQLGVSFRVAIFPMSNNSFSFA